MNPIYWLQYEGEKMRVVYGTGGDWITPKSEWMTDRVEAEVLRARMSMKSAADKDRAEENVRFKFSGGFAGQGD